MVGCLASGTLLPPRQLGVKRLCIKYLNLYFLFLVMCFDFRTGGGGWGSSFGRGGGGGLFGGNRMGQGAGWGTNGWASHAGSAGLGYWLGSRGRAAARPTFPSGAGFQPGSNANTTWSTGSNSQQETMEKSTGYASTKRR